MWSRPLEYAAWWLMLAIAAPVTAIVLISFGCLPNERLYVFLVAFILVATAVLVVFAVRGSWRRRKARRDAGPESQ